MQRHSVQIDVLHALDADSVEGEIHGVKKMNVECGSASIMEGPRITPVTSGLPLHRLFEMNLRKNIDLNERIAVQFEDLEKEAEITTNASRRITYAELETKSNRLAGQILQHLHDWNRNEANADGDRVVLLCMDTSEKLIVAMMAVWKIGAAYLPLDVDTPKNRFEHIINEVHPMAMITDCHRDQHSNFPYKLDYNVLEKKSFDEIETNRSSAPQNYDSVTSTAIILYTSGSTGVPKGVRLAHNTIMNRLNWQWRKFPFARDERICVFKTAVTFVDAVSEIWAPILYSDPRTLLVLAKNVSKDAEKLVHILHAHKVQRLVLVPSLLQAILVYLDMMTSAKKRQLYQKCDLLKSLKLWVCSGEPLPVHLVEKFFSYFNDDDDSYKLCNFYGSTEIMGDVSYYVLNSTKQLVFADKIPIGMPLDNTTLYLLDENFKLVKKGEIGELYVAGFNLATGYVARRDPDRFIKNPFCNEFGFGKLYKTGDYARIIDNVLLYEGRTDSQVKIRGQRVDLSEIQAALSNLKAVHKCAVLCYKPGDINQAIIAFVTLNGGHNFTADDIKSKLKETLTHYAIPRVFIMDNLPLLNNGKVDRQKLLKLYAENTENQSKRCEIKVDFKGVENSKLKAAKCLFETIASTVELSSQNTPTLTMKSNFYEIGGNSLNSIYTISKLREKGYFIGIAEFISAPDLGSVINRMQPEKRDKENIPTIGDLNVKNVRKSNYRCEMLCDKHKEIVYRIITESFYQKADLEQWLIPKLKPDCYTELLDAIWEPLVSKNLSFVLYSELHKKYIGTTLNFDAHDEPEVNISNDLNIIFEFLEFLEGPIRDKKLPKGRRQILHNFMIGTDTSLNAVENIETVAFMETEVLRIGKSKGFAGILTTNTNPLTQQLGRDVFNYQTLLDYQVNQYVASDGTKPFGKAPDDQRAVVAWKPF